MKSFHDNMLPIIFFLIFTHRALSLYENLSQIISLDALSIKKVIIQKEFVLINFYAEKCSKCDALEPMFALATKVLKEIIEDLFVGAINCNENMQVARQLEVAGLPSIKMITRKKNHEFIGYRETMPLVRWVVSFFEEKEVEIKKLAHFKEVITNDVFTLIGFFKDVKSSKCILFQNVTLMYEHLSWAVVNEKEIFDEYNVRKDGHIMMFRQFDDPVIDFKDMFTFENIQIFIDKYSMPLLTEFYDKQSKIPDTFSVNIPNYLIGFMDSTNKRFTLHKMVLEKASKSFLGKVKFIYAKMDNHVSQFLLTICRVKPEEAPAYLFLKLFPDYRTLIYKPSDKKLTSKRVIHFVEGVLQGSRDPELRTEKLHQRWDKYPVKVLVGSNYKEVTQDRTRSVFVQISSEKCVHCVNMRQMWHTLGVFYSDRTDLWIAVIDNDLNDVENLRVESLPTFLYYPSQSKELIKYEGNRTLEDFKVFLNSNGSIHRKNNYTKVIQRSVQKIPGYIKSRELIKEMDPKYRKLLLEEL